MNNLLNLEVIEEEAGVITIQNLKSDIPLKKMISRMYFLTKSMFEDMIASPKEKEVLQSIMERDKLVGKFYLAIIMHLRSLLTQKWNKEISFVEMMDLRLLIERIELVGDMLKIIARNWLQGKKTEAKVVDLQFLLQRYEQAYESYIKQDIKAAEQFWDLEKQDRAKLMHSGTLVRMYDIIKDITDLVI